MDPKDVGVTQEEFLTIFLNSIMLEKNQYFYVVLMAL